MEPIDIEEVQTAPKTELAPIERAALALESSKAEQERVKAEQKAEAEKLAFQRRLMEEERAAIQADLDAKAAMQREEQDRLKAEADAAEAKVRAAAEAMAAERAELERMRAELEAKSKPAEQPAKEPDGEPLYAGCGCIAENKAELLAEDIECLHMALDKAGVPRTDGIEGPVFSMWGRVLRFKEMPSNAELCGG